MKYFFSWLTKKAQKIETSKGFGIFAKEKIEKGERVIVFGGYVMTPEQFNSLSEKLKSFPFQIDNDLYFGLSKISEIEEADYLNHSCDPTCGFDGEITVVAMQDIKKGEEITIDYAMCISSKDIEPMNCVCNSGICRKTITSDDWKRKDFETSSNPENLGNYNYYSGKLFPLLKLTFKV